MGGSSSRDATRGEKEVLAEHEESINCMAISEDGSLLITGSDDKTARMWSTRTDCTECIGILKGHSHYITCLGVCDTYVVTGSADCTVRKWDMTTCEFNGQEAPLVKCKYVYEGHSSRVTRLIVTPEYLFTTSYDKTARVWVFDTDTLSRGEDPCIRVFKGHSLGVSPIIYIPGDVPQDDDSDDEENEEEDDELEDTSQGDIVITGSFDKTAISWSFDTGGKLKVFKGHVGPIICMTTDNKGQILFTGSQDTTVKSWNIQKGECLKTFKGHTGAIMCMQVVKGLMYTGSQDGTARCFVTEFGGEPTRIYKGHKHTVNALHFKNGLLYTVSGDTTCRIFDAKSGGQRKMFVGHEESIICCVVTDNKFYSGSSDGTFRSWDTSNVTVDAAYNADDSDDELGISKSQTDRSLRALEKSLDNYVNVDDLGAKGRKSIS